MEKKNIFMTDHGRGSKKVYYAVQKGWNKGVYDSWKECKAQVTGVRFAKFRKFTDYEEAKQFAFPELYPLQPILQEESRSQTWIKSDAQTAHELFENTMSMKSYLETHPTPLLLPEKDPTDPCLQKRIDVWLAVSKSHGGSFALFFGSQDSRNLTGMYPDTDSLTSTRLRLYGCLVAIQTVKDSAPCTLTVHTENRYLLQSLSRWTTEWYSRDKNTEWARQTEPNHKHLERLCVESDRLGVKLLPVSCQKQLASDNNMKLARLMLRQ